MERPDKRILGPDRTWLEWMSTRTGIRVGNVLALAAVGGFVWLINRPDTSKTETPQIARQATPTNRNTILHCYADMDAVSLTGTLSIETLRLADTSEASVSILTTPNTVCVDEIWPSDPDKPQRAHVSRFQLIGKHPKLTGLVEVRGKLSTGNVTQSYAEPNAIDVANLRLVETSSRAGADNELDTDRELTYCIMPKAQFGQYSSYDGGRSAMALLQACPFQWVAWTEDCIRKSGKSEGDCNAAALIVAQVVIKQLGK